MKLAQIAVSPLDHMGSDLTVANAARVSFGKRSEEFTPRDKGLIRYLAEHGHWSPLAHPQLSFHIKAPIFVARQLAKHQVGLAWNEVSRRYVDEEPEFYVPYRDEWRGRAEDKKQGSSEVIIEYLEHVITDTEYNGEVRLGGERGPVREYLQVALDLYRGLLAQEVAPEQARMVLPLCTMTEWHWTGSLYAFARVCQLRLEPDAQAETREVAEGIAHHARGLFPVSWEALLGGDRDEPELRSVGLCTGPDVAAKVGAEDRVDVVANLAPVLAPVDGTDTLELGHQLRDGPGGAPDQAA